MFSWSECWSNPSNQKEIGRRLCWKTWGWWYGWRRRRWITNMIQSEEIRSISRRACSGSISTITRPPLIWLWFMFQQHTDSRGGKKNIWNLFISKQWSTVRTITSDRPFSRQLKETPGVLRSVSLLFEEFDLRPACSRCVSWLPVLAMADLPALGLGN